MSIRTHFASIFAALLVTTGSIQAARAEPLRLSYFVWPGYGPFFVAQEKGFFAKEEKGFFAKEGVEVELINIEDHGAVVAGLSSGQITAFWVPPRTQRRFPNRVSPWSACS